MPTVALAPRRKSWTDEELLRLPHDGHKYELLEGELTMSPVFATHGVVSARILILVGNHVEAHDLGEVYDSSTGCRLSPKLLLSPDVAFVSKARLKALRPAEGFLQGAPDLAVEVLSPSDRMVEVHRKLDHYFAHGTRLAWLVNPRHEQIHIYTEDGLEALTRPEEWLTGGAVLPGFKCRVRKVFRAG